MESMMSAEYEAVRVYFLTHIPENSITPTHTYMEIYCKVVSHPITRGNSFLLLATNVYQRFACEGLSSMEIFRGVVTRQLTMHYFYIWEIFCTPSFIPTQITILEI
jgi:hypothetical protein